MEEKVLFKEDIVCPYCKKLVSVERVKEIIEKPVKGEYQERLVVTKSEQKSLNE